MTDFRPVVLGVLLYAAVGCSTDRIATWAAPGVPPTGLVTIMGTTRLAPVEVGCWTLVTPQHRYEPINLPAAFRIDDLTVRAVVHPVSGASVCMVGELVAVDTIQTR
jgi:hypothetical protein